MHRLFVAFRPSQPITATLQSAMGDISGAKWQRDDQLHLTLRYIGKVDRRMAEDALQAVEAIDFVRFEAELSGVGHFDSKDQGNPIWAGVAPYDGLHALHKKVDHALTRFGLPSEHRAYRPHITLARLSRNAADPSAWLVAHAGLSSPRFPIDHITLFESILTSDSAHYREIATIRARR